MFLALNECDTITSASSQLDTDTLHKQIERDWTPLSYLSLRVTPQPSSRLATLQIYGLHSVRGHECMVLLYDQLGNQVQNLSKIVNDNNDGISSVSSLDLTGLSSGLYVVTLQVSIYSKSSKLIVIH